MKIEIDVVGKIGMRLLFEWKISKEKSNLNIARGKFYGPL